jgi:uncharacterized membrane protein
MLLLVAYVCMTMTFVTGLLWIVSVLIAWQLQSNTDDPSEKLHCRWILKSNLVLVIGVVISLLLLLAGMPGLSSNSTPAFIALFIGIAIIVCGGCWYFYRTVRGMIALHGSSLLPNA